MNMPKDAAQRALLALKSQIMQMEKELASAIINHNHIHNQLAPISSLPYEVLSAIFKAGCLSQPQRSGSTMCLPFEMLVSQISQDWRSVALETSQLWANIALTPKPHCFEIADLYLHRSKMSALYLWIYIDRKNNTIEDITTFCRLIDPHVGRWRRLHIDCDWRRGFDHLLACLPSAAPILQRITSDRIYDDHLDGDGDDADVPRRIFMAGAPYLTTILLTGGVLLPPTTTITHLWLDTQNMNMTPTSLRTTFTGLSALTHMVIGTDFFIDSEDVVGNSVELPLLRCLHIIPFEDDRLICNLLIIISAPSLQHLLLESFFWDDVLNLAHEASFNSALKYPFLRSLTVLASTIERPTLSNWWSLIGSFPKVTQVAVSCFENIFLQSLDKHYYPVDPANSTALWQTLHTLTLPDQPHHLDVDTISTTVSARIAVGHPIQKLQLSKPIMLMLGDEMEKLQTHVEVEECTIHPRLGDISSIDNWLDRNCCHT